MSSEAVPEPAVASPAPKSSSRAPSLLKAAGLIAAVTILSKFLGMVRDIGIGSVYGTSMVTDAYFEAFQLPSFAVVLLGGLGGPFHTATIAIFSRLVRDDEAPDEKARKLASTFITLTGIVFTLLSIAAFLLAEPIMNAILHGGNPALVHMAAQQLRIMSPIILVGGLVGIFYGLLNIYHVFFWPSLSPAALSLFILVVLFCLPKDSTGDLLAWATLGGACLQLLIQLPEFWKRGFTVKPAMEWKTPEIRQVSEMLFPAIVSTTIGQLNVYVDMFFTSFLPVGGWTAVIFGNRLIQFPIGVLQTALLVPIFPRFSRAAAEGDMEAIKRDFRVGVVSLWLISIPMLVLILVDSEPIIRLIFQHGHFDAHGTDLVSQAMLGLAFQMLPYFARDSITRVFFAFKDTRTPLFVGLFAILTNAFFDWFFAAYMGWGVRGITFSTTMVTFINMLLLGILSKRHIQDLGFKEMLLPFLKLSIAGLLMAGVAYALQPVIQHGLEPMLHGLPALVAQYTPVVLAALIATVFYFVLAWLLKVEEAEYIYKRLRKSR